MQCASRVVATPALNPWCARQLHLNETQRQRSIFKNSPLIIIAREVFIFIRQRNMPAAGWKSHCSPTSEHEKHSHTAPGIQTRAELKVLALKCPYTWTPRELEAGLRESLENWNCKILCRGRSYTLFFWGEGTWLSSNSLTGIQNQQLKESLLFEELDHNLCGKLVSQLILVWGVTLQVHSACEPGEMA